VKQFIHINSLEISYRTYNLLMKHLYPPTIGALATLDLQQFEKLKGVGPKTIKEIRSVLPDIVSVLDGSIELNDWESYDVWGGVRTGTEHDFRNSPLAAPELIG
jgi:hypothetical protein